MSWIDALGERRRVHHGQVLLWGTLAAAAFLSEGHTACCNAESRTGDVVTVISWLPESLLTSVVLFEASRGLFVFFSICWLLQLMVPWTSWGAVFTFTLTVAMHEEQLGYVDHTYQLTNMMMLLLAIWYQHEARNMRTALAEGTFWSRPLMPNWVVALAMFRVVLFYTLAGIGKLSTSGIGWANGVSLQLWVHHTGSSGSVSRWIAQHRQVAVAAQAMTLVAETTAAVAVLYRPTRWIVAVLLIGFHIAQSAVFGWAFHGNLLLVALTLLPVREGVERATERLRKRFGHQRELPPSRVGRFLVSRFDAVGVWQLPAAR